MAWMASKRVPLNLAIPEGFAGDPSEIDPARSDASPWDERLPMIADFRRRVIGRRGRSKL